MKIVVPALVRPLLTPFPSASLDIAWFANHDEANAMVVDAEVAWLDQARADWTTETIDRGTKLRWLSTIYSGIDSFPVAKLRQRGTLVTNGGGINTAAVAEYALLGILAAAKRYDEVIRLADQQIWPRDAPGKAELYGSEALIVGMGRIGQMIADRLAAFGVRVTGVTRSGRNGTLRPHQWRAALGRFDWVILSAPSTEATTAMISANELTTMRSTAWLINIGRGSLVDQGALVSALDGGTIAGAFLDTVHPEPLPAGHALWTAPNVLHSMHLSGRSQSGMFQRGATLFLENLAAYLAGQPMRNVVDLEAGY